MSSSIRIGIIGGTGLGEALLEGMDARGLETRDLETPFGPPSAPIAVGRYGQVPIAFLPRHGKGHLFNPAAVPYRANIYALKALGCTHVLASGAAGSLREEYAPGDLVVCDQLIDRTSGRSRTFYERAAVHVEFADPCCPIMRRWLLQAGRGSRDLRLHERGTYLCMNGPSFSTRAESHLHRSWGADLVGMTALPEARLAREAELAYALLALPTDYDCWRERDQVDSSSLLEEIIANLQQATRSCIELIRSALADISILRETPSPAHDALTLAIWSDKTLIDPEEIQRLHILWGRHFASAPAR